MRCPVISVGNLAVGGRGKTPLVATIATWLVAAGERPSILTRGYKRRHREDGVVVVSDGTHLLADLDRSGDEPLMLARDVPGARVLVCELRGLAGQLAERALGATVHVLDDGFQHRALARDVDLVIVSPADLSDRRLPFGRLREPVSALRRADAILVDGDGPVDVDGRPSFQMRRSLGALVPMEPGTDVPRSGARVVTVAGIANPDRFAAAVRAAGWDVADHLTFADHHQYDRKDLARVSAVLARSGASAVVTTAKDAVRLRPLRPLPCAVCVAPLVLSIAREDEFHRWLFDRVREARA